MCEGGVRAGSARTVLIGVFIACASVFFIHMSVTHRHSDVTSVPLARQTQTALAALAAVLLLVGCGQSRQPSPMRSPSPEDWAGYVTMRVGVSRVTASWRQPKIVPSGKISGVAIWVGLVGKAGHTIEQVGIDAVCNGGDDVRYDPWFELYPEPSVSIGFTVRPGDLIVAGVTKVGADSFRLTLTDATDNASFSSTKQVPGVGTTAAAIMVEKPSGPDSGELARFHTVRFAECAIDGRSLNDFKLDQFDIAANGEDTTTSPVSLDGTSFTVTYVP